MAVRVNCICPGLVDTPASRRSRARMTPGEIAALPPVLSPADIAAAAMVFLADDTLAGDSTGGSAAISPGVIRARDRREAGVSTRPGQMQLTRTAMVSRSPVHALRGEPFRDPGAYPRRTSRDQSGHPVEFHGGSVRPGTDISRPGRPGTGYLPPR